MTMHKHKHWPIVLPKCQMTTNNRIEWTENDFPTALFRGKFIEEHTNLQLEFPKTSGETESTDVVCLFIGAL